MEKLQPTPLRVLVYKDNGEWVAHVLEFDIVGTGDTEEEAEQQLIDAIDCHLSFCMQEGMNPFSPAPQELERVWNRKQREMFEIKRSGQAKYQSYSYPMPSRNDQTVYKQFANI